MSDFLHRRMGRAVFGIAMLSIAFATARPSIAFAEPRFGDSTWVAPAAAFAEDPETPGPRVAPRDHERTWETVLRAPFRLAFLPFRAVARGIEALGPVAEHFYPPGQHTKTSGSGLYLSPELIGATVGYREFAGPGSKAAVTGTWSPRSQRLRFRGYVGERVSTVGLNVNALYERKTNRHFFGFGNESPYEVSYYLRRSQVADAALFFGKNSLRRFRAGGGISDMHVAGSPDLDPDVPIVSDLDTRLSWYGVSADFGALDDSIQPSSGFHFRPMARRYQDMDGTDVRYDQWRLEARGYAPVFAKHRVLAARVVYEGVDPRDGSAPIPFYRLAESADDDAFSAYTYGRFRDRRLALGRMEYRWKIVDPVWAYLLGELGEVAPSARAFTLADAHRSIGGGVRAAIGARIVRFLVANGEDGLEVHGDLRSTW